MEIERSGERNVTTPQNPDSMSSCSTIGGLALDLAQNEKGCCSDVFANAERITYFRDLSIPARSPHVSATGFRSKSRFSSQFS